MRSSRNKSCPAALLPTSVTKAQAKPSLRTVSIVSALKVCFFPYGYENDFMRPVYPVDTVDPLRFFSPDEVSSARSIMKGWVESLSRYGR